jgi:hypothetical protein
VSGLIKKKVTKHVRKGVKQVSALQSDVRKNTATALLAALAFVMALVWRDAIQEIVNDILAYFDIVGTTAKYKVIAALITSVICSIGIIYFSRWGEKKK